MDHIISLLIRIKSNGNDIKSSNYWHLMDETRGGQKERPGLARAGLFYLSFVEDACRVLLSPKLEDRITYIQNAADVVLSYGPLIEGHSKCYCEIAFYDKSDDLWGLMVPDTMANYTPTAEAHGVTTEFSFWLPDGPVDQSTGMQDGYCVARKQAIIQIPDSIPCLQRLFQPDEYQSLLSYKRAQAIRDGIWVDLSHLPGLKLALVCTRGASSYMDYIMNYANLSLEDLVATILEAGRQRYRELEGSKKLIDFDVSIAARTFNFRLYVGPHDDENLVTILMLPCER